jgi:hypothetical protein
MNKKTPTYSAKSTHFAKQSSENIGQTVSSLMTSKLLPTPEAKNQEGYQMMRGKRYMRLGSQINLFSSLVDSHANHSVKLDEEKERTTTATSGLSCLRLYEVGNRHGSSLKTCVGFLLSAEAWYSNKCALTWKAQATKSSRLLFQLSPSTRPTEGIGYGLLPTVRTTEAEGGTIKNPELHNGSWSRKNKNGTRHGIKVKDVIENLLPTPDVSDRRSNQSKQLGTSNIVGKQTGLKLQPAFVEWMMGYELGWTDLGKLETPETQD